MYRCITYFILFYSSQLMATPISYDVTLLAKGIFISPNPPISFRTITVTTENNSASFTPEDTFIVNTNETFIENSQSLEDIFSYEKVLLNTSVEANKNEQYSLQHYLHVKQKSFLTKGHRTWLTSGAGVTLFESNNYDFDDKKTFSLSLGLHSNFVLTNKTKLVFSSEVFANYLNNNSNNMCTDITCLLSNKGKLWLQKSVTLNLSMTF